jgi:hypothetical protein
MPNSPRHGSGSGSGSGGGGISLKLQSGTYPWHAAINVGLAPRGAEARGNSSFKPELLMGIMR